MADRGVKIVRLSQRVAVALGPLRSGRALANATVIAGERATAVIDTMISPAMALPVRDAAAELGAGRGVAYVINTHGDPDHLLGNALFGGALVVAQARVAEVLARPEVRERYLRMLQAQAEGEEREEVTASLALREPDLEFERELTIRLGSLSARLRYVGPAHSVADSIVWVEEERLLVVADIVFNDCFPLIRDDLDNWFAGLELASSFAPERVVPGHGEVGGPELLEWQAALLSEIREAVKSLYTGGMSVETAAQEPVPAGLRALALAEERWPNAVRGIYGVLARNSVAS